MKIRVRVYPNSAKEGVAEENGLLKVHLAAQPEKGKANKRLLEVLADYLDKKKSSLSIVRGFTSKDKVVAVDDADN